MSSLCDLIKYVWFEIRRLALEDRIARFIIWRLKVNFKSSSKSRLNPFLQHALARRFVTGDHNLLARHVKLVEGVEETFLRLWLRCDELDIVDH